MVFYFDFLLKSRSLAADGSNFIYWYNKLRDTLIHNNLLYVIEEALGEEPDDSASEEDDEEFRQRRDIFLEVQTIMSICLAPELKALFRDLEPYDMIEAIKTHFVDKIKLEQFRQLRMFYSLQLEEHTCLETHLKKMYDIYRKLTNVYDYWMADSCAITAALMSLTPSYEEHVQSYAVRIETMSFLEFISQFKSVKVEPIEGELFDATGIFDIRSYECILPVILDEKYFDTYSVYETGPEDYKYQKTYDMTKRK
jgi:hypothetical protein